MRQFISKDASIDDYNRDDYNRQYVENIVDRISDISRRIPGCQTSDEVFNKGVRAIIKQSA